MAYGEPLRSRYEMRYYGLGGDVVQTFTFIDSSVSNKENYHSVMCLGAVVMDKTNRCPDVNRGRVLLCA